MKISILTPNFSSNCFGRAWLLAKVLQRKYNVEVIGPTFSERIWKPLESACDFDIKMVRGYANGHFELKKMLDSISGDVIYASKPLMSSFGVALIKKVKTGKPVILDIDDWELGFVLQKFKESVNYETINFFIKSTIRPLSYNSFWNIVLLDKLSHFADSITIPSSFLKKRFGGAIVYHGRDTDIFDPSKFSPKTIRKSYGLPLNKKIVIFFGTFRKHKGIEHLIKSIHLLENPDVMLLLVGLNDSAFKSEIEVHCKNSLGENYRIYGFQPFNKLPEFLAMSDVVVIPQNKNAATIGQVPAKIFDAMAMAKPIIATNVSDLPEILVDCGWIVEPEKPEQLAQTIKYVLDNPEEAMEMGWKARQKCIEKYSWDAMEKVLIDIFKKYEN